jgi:hypothetical protein
LIIFAIALLPVIINQVVVWHKVREGELPMESGITAAIIAAGAAIFIVLIGDIIGNFRAYKKLSEALGNISKEKTYENIYSALGTDGKGSIMNALGTDGKGSIMGALGTESNGSIMNALGTEGKGSIMNALRTDVKDSIMDALGTEGTDGMNITAQLGVDKNSQSLTGQHRNILTEISRINERAEKKEGEARAVTDAGVKRLMDSVDTIAAFRDLLVGEYTEKIELKKKLEAFTEQFERERAERDELKKELAIVKTKLEASEERYKKVRDENTLLRQHNSDLEARIMNMQSELNEVTRENLMLKEAAARSPGQPSHRR